LKSTIRIPKSAIELLQHSIEGDVKWSVPPIKITRRNNRVKFPRVVFICLLVGLLLGQISTSMAGTEDEQNNIEIYEAAAPGVVNITTVSV